MEIRQGKTVEFNNGPVNGIGVICGIATVGEAIIGRSIIIEIIKMNINREEYPYTHACFFESQIKEV